MERDNYHALITIPANDGNFTAALGYANPAELTEACRFLENHPAGNKTRLAAVKREIRHREKKAQASESRITAS